MLCRLMIGVTFLLTSQLNLNSLKTLQSSLR